MALTREDFVMQSVQDYLKEQLFTVRGNPEDKVQITDAWQGEKFETPLAKNVVASGYNFDDGGKAAEMGSDLMVRLYTVEFFIFGMSATWGRNLAQGIKFSLENDGIIPIVDITDAARPPTGEVLVLDSVTAAREPISDPPEWQRYLWITTARVEDTYHARVP